MLNRKSQTSQANTWVESKNVVMFTGWWIGAYPKKNPSELDANGDRMSDSEWSAVQEWGWNNAHEGHFHLPTHAKQLFSVFASEASNHGLKFNLVESDILSIKWRKEVVENRVKGGWKWNIYQTWIDFMNSDIVNADLFIKFPGETLTNEQIIQKFIDSSFSGNPQDSVVINQLKEYYKVSLSQAKKIHWFLRMSPNDWIRRKLKQTTIYRPFAEAQWTHKPIEFQEGQDILLDVIERDEVDGDNFYKSIWEWRKQKVIRELTMEQINSYCDKVIIHARSTWKKIIIPTKWTITKFEARFLQIIESRIKEANAEWANIQHEKMLTDAFLDRIPRNSFPSNTHAVASVPNIIAALNEIKNITREDINENVDTYKEMHFFRWAVKDGYNEDFVEEDDLIRETNSLVGYVSKRSIKDAYNKAVELNDVLTLVIDDTNNQNNERAKQYASEITKGNYKVISLGEYMYKSIVSPHELGSVFVWSNVIGDLISDFNAGIACSRLWIGKSLWFAPSVDSNGIVLEANPAAWTAEGIANNEFSDSIVPISILLSMILAREQLSISRNEYKSLKDFILRMKKALFDTQNKYIVQEIETEIINEWIDEKDPNFKRVNYRYFTKDLIDAIKVAA